MVGELCGRAHCKQLLIHMRRFQEFHGRLGFAAQVLPWIRPMLAPGYSLDFSSGTHSHVEDAPTCGVNLHIHTRQIFNGIQEVALWVNEVSLGEIFRTDAKCENIALCWVDGF